MGEKDVIVTGGAGYIGSHTCKALAVAGYNPVTYDNLSIGNRWAVRWGPLEIGDIRDTARLTEVFRQYRPAGVLHFAALALVGESVVAPARYYDLNVHGAQCVFDAARFHDVGGLVFSSTCAVYGIPNNPIITEETPQVPINPYGASKLMAERLLRDYDSAYGLRHVALRYFNAAGADPDGEIGERRNVETHLIPLAIEACLGLGPALKVLGEDHETVDGTPVRDYIHVSDLAEAHVASLARLLQGEPSRVLNLGTGRGASVREVIAAIEQAAGRPVPVETAPRRPGDPPQLVADAARALKLFGPDLVSRSSLDSIVATALRWRSGNALSARFQSNS